jgi:hypothetical protein
MFSLVHEASVKSNKCLQYEQTLKKYNSLKTRLTGFIDSVVIRE